MTGIFVRWLHIFGRGHLRLRAVLNWHFPVGQANERGLLLLKRNLTAAQRQQFETQGFFHVIGGTTGNRYRIHAGRQMNVEELNERGNRIAVLCFMPEGDLVNGDVMLAQKLALELYEPEAIMVANRTPAAVTRFLLM